MADDGAFQMLAGLLPAAGLEHWKEVVVANCLPISAALALLLLVPLLLGLLPGLGFTGPRTFLNPEEFKELPLVERKQLSHNTVWMKCALSWASARRRPTGQPVHCSWFFFVCVH